MIGSFAVIFIFCECGERVCGAFDEINETFDQFNWYLLPIEEQNKLLMLLSGAQISITFRCFGSISCVREVFKQVCMVVILLLLIESIL